MTASKSARDLLNFGLFITALGGFLFTFDLPLLRIAQSEKWTLVFVRGILLFLSLSTVWYITQFRKGGKLRYIDGGGGWAVVASTTLANIALIGATLETTIANVVCILALVPIFTAVFSRTFINERIHPYTWLAAAVALVGVGIIVWDGLKGGNWFGDFLALVCACCTAVSFTIIRATKRNVATSLALGGLCSAVIALAIFPINLASLLAPAAFGAPSWLWLALNGLLVVPLASTLIVNGLRYLPSADVSMFFLLESVLAPVWVWLFLGEQPSTAVLYGGVLIIVTLFVHSAWRLRTTLTAPHSAGI
jgi:drug/metabolite transporter (DMT)-like permease